MVNVLTVYVLDYFRAICLLCELNMAIRLCLWTLYLSGLIRSLW